MFLFLFIFLYKTNRYILILFFYYYRSYFIAINWIQHPGLYKPTERSKKMKDILKNISVLDGFMSNEQFTSAVLFSNDNDVIPPICNDYNGPDDPIDSRSE